MLKYILIPLLPFTGFLIAGLFGKYLKERAATVAVAGVFGSFVFAVWAFIDVLGGTLIDENLYSWITIGNLNINVGFQIDQLTVVMLMVVTTLSTLIHIYSIGYMHGDKGFARFFAYLELFTFFMLVLVMANNFLLMFVGWEGVGLCSYLLIGFWYEKKSASDAGIKAFVVNRVGDFGFVLGMMLIFVTFGTLDFTDVFAQATPQLAAQNIDLLGMEIGIVTLICVLLFVGATGKSAQIPLYVWLPDAMEGPTPVSALIHAATMVTAGVFMVARCAPLFILSHTAMNVVAVVGGVTAIFAATIGLVQNDIKRVIAYSTISQLGYMFVAVGVGAYSAGIFHLMTHAFFKGLLFLGAGSIMHAMSGELDMRKMGGLRKKIPITYWTFFIACLAIAGIPGFSGFFSKDEILWKAFSSPHGHIMIWLLAALTAGMTAFYMFRLLFGVFYGDCRAPEDIKRHIHESPKVMTVPLMILAFLAIAGGYVGIPHVLGGTNLFDQFLAPVLGGGTAHSEAAAASFSLISSAWASGAEAAGEASLEMTLMVASVITALIGISLAYWLYVANTKLPGKFTAAFPGLFKVVNNKYFVDELYDFVFVRGILKAGALLLKVVDIGIIEGIVNGTGSLLQWAGGHLRKLETGVVQQYAFGMILGAIVVVGYIVLAPLF